MKKSMVVVAFAGVVGLLSCVSQAGLVDLGVAGAESEITLSDTFPKPLGMDFSAGADSSSHLTLTTTLTNETGFVWTGYILGLDPEGEATFVEGSGQSTDFQTVLYPDAWTIEFQAPHEVPPGEVVTLEFRMSIPDSMPFTFTLTQNPVPEPATAALLGLGALVLLGRRRR